MSALCQRMALWFVGLPGSGKSSVARETLRLLQERDLDPVHLEMDQRRKEYIPDPQYTREEREQAYTMFAEEAAELVAQGGCVLMDGTANELRWRRQAREFVGKVGGFAEVYVACSLETAMQREAERPQGKVKAELYRKALERQRTGREFPGLGDVVGVDVPFEQDPRAELTLDSEARPPQENAWLVLAYLESLDTPAGQE